MRRLRGLAFFVIYPILEVIAIVWVGGAIGWGWTFLILLAGFVAGLLIIRSAGTAAFGALTGTDPVTSKKAGLELRGSGILFAGGALIAAPGFLNDLAGLILVLPPVRVFLARRFDWAGPRRGTVIVGEVIVMDDDEFRPTWESTPDPDVIQGQILPPDRGEAGPIV
ncbi:MAG: FxsA family protein [Candidatus Nanopelagicales bacterium]|nr:FxsA family protein [Candidatus Nanopelagicales bacterium]MDZ4250050.1 FxsA family protein [Candidatus Nanopelagicales bacterium]MDZ7577755.1 FxsA family protein [Candidatus Nanopelagicales bacterium]